MTGSSLAPEIDRRIFVVGAPRSGTTLVQSLLAAHGEATSFTESHFFDRHFSLLPFSTRALLTRTPAPRLQEFLAENGEEPTPAARITAPEDWSAPTTVLLPLRTRVVARRLLRVLDELALRRGRSSWIEKTPRHLRYVPFLERMCGPREGLRFVHVVRRGLQAVASLHRASQSWERPYDLAECARRWNDDLGLSLRRMGSPRDSFVLYEELTARPEPTLRRLFSELGLGWEPEILERYGEVSGRLVTAAEQGWKQEIDRQIRPSAAAERSLSAKQRRQADRAVRQELYERLRQQIGEACPR